MKHSEYSPRIIDPMVERYLKTFGAVCLEGPKWCGKTWTSSEHSASEFYVGDPAGNFQNRQLAELEPATVLKGDQPRLVDEWQEVPALWDAVRFEVDQTRKKGQFILTGSSTPRQKGVLHSGTGRIARLRIRPMSLYEMGLSSGEVSLESLCHGTLATNLSNPTELKTLAEMVIRGGWPESINMPISQASIIPKEYLKAVIENDVDRADGKTRNKHKVELLLRSLARNESTVVTNKTLKKDIKEEDDEDIDIDTVAEYLDVFERLFLIENQKPFSTNIRSGIRVKKQEKRHFCDPSLACALLNATPEMLIGDLNTFGFLFEAMVERDLRIYAESFDAQLYHYQNYRNQEIDAVIELQDGNWCAFEIKLGANQIDSAASGLIQISKDIQDENGKAPTVLGIICGTANAAYKRPDDVFVVPITMLKN
ncbi:MAG: ATP-binding protein [Clostridia bacterium]|nr:ATP-binding protein [Clostridia bacterium]MBQ8469017.1 ATP-binding protein [Clostridia bacterium]